MTPEGIDVLEYATLDGESPFRVWFGNIDARAAAKVATALTRLGQGNFGDVKGVGSGVFERRIDFGPGYRVYFGKDGATIVILLGGGTKQRQERDIDRARERWRDYQERKRKGERTWL